MTKAIGERLLTTRFSAALFLAAELHASQERKKDGRHIPYVAHVMSVAALILEDGGSEDEAIAGLLHDAVEDQGLTEERIRAEFGGEVARIVMACTDAVAEPGAKKADWLPRKKEHIAKLQALGADTAVLRVTAADKLHNCRDILADIELYGGTESLRRFRGGIGGTCWYYGQMSQVVTAGLPDDIMAAALDEAVHQLHEQCGQNFPAPEPTRHVPR